VKSKFKNEIRQILDDGGEDGATYAPGIALERDGVLRPGPKSKTDTREIQER